MTTKEWFKQTAYNGKITYETYQKCDCTECKKEDCIHRESYRRMPKEVGGLGLCMNLKEEESMKTYYIKTNGNEDNGFQPIICGYDYAQYKEIIASLKERKIPYVTWCE